MLMLKDRAQSFSPSSGVEGHDTAGPAESCGCSSFAPIPNEPCGPFTGAPPLQLLSCPDRALHHAPLLLPSHHHSPLWSITLTCRSIRTQITSFSFSPPSVPSLASVPAKQKKNKRGEQSKATAEIHLLISHGLDLLVCRWFNEKGRRQMEPIRSPPVIQNQTRAGPHSHP